MNRTQTSRVAVFKVLRFKGSKISCLLKHHAHSILCLFLFVCFFPQRITLREGGQVVNELRDSKDTAGRYWHGEQRRRMSHPQPHRSSATGLPHVLG